MQHGDFASLIELDPKVAEKVIPPQKGRTYWTKAGTKLDCAPRDNRDERSLSNVVIAKPCAGNDGPFMAACKVDP